MTEYILTPSTLTPFPGFICSMNPTLKITSSHERNGTLKRVSSLSSEKRLKCSVVSADVGPDVLQYVDPPSGRGQNYVCLLFVDVVKIESQTRLYFFCQYDLQPHLPERPGMVWSCSDRLPAFTPSPLAVSGRCSAGGNGAVRGRVAG